jgi:hypothetical protein
MSAPHDPVIAEGGRRCNRCRLLPEEHPPLVWVATLDTGGISHSGRVIIAVGASEDEAQRAAFRQLMGRKRRLDTAYGGIIRTVQDASDYYGMST